MKNLAIILASVAIALVVASPALVSAQTGMACTMQYDPVCGMKSSVGGGKYQTFGNACVAGSEGAVIQHRGECTADELAGRGTGAYVPPATCTAWFDGCNSCGRGEDGQSFCTLRACLGEPAAWYCTAYASDPKPAPEPRPGQAHGYEPSTGVEIIVNPEAAATDEPGTVEGNDGSAVEPMPEQKGFLLRVWTGISAWFTGLL